MKSFFLKVRELQDFLLARIAKGDINIAEINGIKIQDEGVSLDRAKNIIKRAKDYKKESSRFTADSGKIVLQKNIFLKILQAANLSFMFFLGGLDDKGTSYLLVKDEDQKKLKKLKRPIENKFR